MACCKQDLSLSFLCSSDERTYTPCFIKSNYQPYLVNECTVSFRLTLISFISFFDGSLLTFPPHLFLLKSRSVWSHLSIKAHDQLRQRVAFALNQIFAVVKPVRESEPILNYHDIFVRNAFGNWKDLLREVAYSPLMAMNLSYLASKSMAYVRATQNQFSFADENFAREVSIRQSYQSLCSLPSKSHTILLSPSEPLL